MTVRVTATDAEQARREAATLLAQHLRDLDHRISADTLAVDYTTVTNQ